MVFNPNQIKLVSNLNPTNDQDMRYFRPVSYFPKGENAARVIDVQEYNDKGGKKNRERKAGEWEPGKANEGESDAVISVNNKIVLIKIVAIRNKTWKSACIFHVLCIKWSKVVKSG